MFEDLKNWFNKRKAKKQDKLVSLIRRIILSKSFRHVRRRQDLWDVDLNQLTPQFIITIVAVVIIENILIKYKVYRLSERSRKQFPKWEQGHRP